MGFLLSGADVFILVAALSIDALAASFAYGTNRIKIPAKSIGVISLVCTAVLAISMLIGNIIGSYIPKSVTSDLCFGILLRI